MFENILVQSYPALAGLGGGAISGVLSWIDKNKEFPLPFDFTKFAYSIIPALLTGFASGFFTEGNVLVAFAAGLVGKKLWETFKA